VGEKRNGWREKTRNQTPREVVTKKTGQGGTHRVTVVEEGGVGRRKSMESDQVAEEVSATS